VIYREHAYSVVQTGNPAGWTWTVQLEGSGSQTGASHRREAAIVAAFAAIDQVIKAASHRNALSYEIIDGRMIPKSEAQVDGRAEDSGRDMERDPPSVVLADRNGAT